MLHWNLNINLFLIEQTNYIKINQKCQHQKKISKLSIFLTNFPIVSSSLHFIKFVLQYFFLCLHFLPYIFYIVHCNVDFFINWRRFTLRNMLRFFLLHNFWIHRLYVPFRLQKLLKIFSLIYLSMIYKIFNGEKVWRVKWHLSPSLCRITIFCASSQKKYQYLCMLLPFWANLRVRGINLPCKQRNQGSRWEGFGAQPRKDFFIFFHIFRIFC